MPWLLDVVLDVEFEVPLDVAVEEFEGVVAVVADSLGVVVTVVLELLLDTLGGSGSGISSGTISPDSVSVTFPPSGVWVGSCSCDSV